MLCLESSILVDTLDPDRAGHDDARTFLERHRNKPLFLPTVCVWEVLRGPAKSGDEAGFSATANKLEFGFQLPFDGAAAREAATIELEQMQKGQPLNVRDYAVAGTVRHYGGTIATRDERFASISGLNVVTY